MGLPAYLRTVFREETGEAQPLRVARGLTDLGGAIGETYLALSSDSLVLFTTKLGSECQSVRYSLKDVSVFECRGTDVAPEVRVGTGVRVWRVPLPTHAMGEVQAMVAAWRRAVGAAEPAENIPETTVSRDTPAEQRTRADPSPCEPAELCPVTAFSAALHAMVRADETAGTEELHLISRLIERPEYVERGIRYLERVGVQSLLEAIPLVLDERQGACLIANLMEIAMVDGRLKRGEKELLQAFQDAVNLPEGLSQGLQRFLRIKNDLSVFEYPAE